MSSGDSPAEHPLVASVVPLVPAWRVDHTFDYAVPGLLADRIRPGSLVRVPFGHRNVRGVVVAIGDSSEERALEPILAAVVEVPIAPPPLDRLAGWIAARYAVPTARAFERFVPPRVRARPAEPVSLTGGPAPARIKRYRRGAELMGAIERGDAGTWSLRVLLDEDRGALIAELIAAAARAGRGAALVAVPEVRYGSEVLDTLASRWPELARVDSAVGDSDRAAGWLRLAAGHGLGGGGRATVLAPVPDLRLLVVDEEHHLSYKEDRAPRYDARRVAVERARLQGAVCVLVSTTPSLEVGWAAGSGAFGSVEPTRNDARAARPVVEVVETDPERALGRVLHRRIADVLGRGERVALLVPGRGWSRAVWCANCRRSLRCPLCEAGLAYDRGGDLLRCPVCGNRTPHPSACPNCRAVDFRYLGAGSERLADQIGRAFPRARVTRVDPDTIASSQEMPPGDIYVATWIGTKAAIRPQVALVGVLDADAFIRQPDFRAAENAYHALVEMAAWAGPASTGGRLVIQTSDPRHHAVQAVVRGDYSWWLQREAEHRQELSYPPLSELIEVTATGPDRTALLDEIGAIATDEGAVVLGPTAVTARRPGRRRGEGLRVLLKCGDATAVAARLRGILARAPSGALRIDTDPR